ncbi:F-box/LRR-repeat protein 13-like [Chenopodium quinoa]|uniref:FBD domain-containing protein n=1 Tax=Chenopodium quinoa TaxID=63459 RepID=A0A803MPS0_CHEQI|nr:F-box/LRR-repeat protein 13-like [Chenopodium quinoa]
MGNASYIERLETVKRLRSLQFRQLSFKTLNLMAPSIKFLAAGCNNKLTQTFNHLQKLCLTELDLDDFNVFRFTISMVQNCPYIKDLELSITPNKSILQHKFDYGNNNKLGHLAKAKITGITGSSVELKLIEYVLGISVVLEKLLLKCNDLDSTSELKVMRELLQLPRASTKAKILCFA